MRYTLAMLVVIAKKRASKVRLPEKFEELVEFRFRLRRFLGFSEMAAEAVGISAQQYQLLQVIAATPAAQPASISYVAERMIVRHNSAVELVDRAERSGLVRRVVDETDHRRMLIEITTRGSELLNLLVARHLTEIAAEGPELMRALQTLLTQEGEAK
jgi:DNA-binding MarR family transcriptional regulator